MLLGAARILVALASFAIALVAAQPRLAAGDQSVFMPVGLSTLTPFGWADFCQRYRSECEPRLTDPVAIPVTTANSKLIERVNRAVNAAIKPMSDAEHWNVVDRWDIPSDGYGDCEDYALLKRKLLIAAGLPRQALLMTVVRDENDEGHAVLTVATERGDFVLDNMTDQIKLWSRTSYRFVKRQSQEDQNAWVAAGAPLVASRSVSH
jgi:predicted transglutaminase-like cysteine proteinase